MNTTNAFILAIGIAVAGISFAVGQGTNRQAPGAINGCIFYASAFTLSDGQRTAFLCDTNGRLKVTTTP